MTSHLRHSIFFFSIKSLHVFLCTTMLLHCFIWFRGKVTVITAYLSAMLIESDTREIRVWCNLILLSKNEMALSQKLNLILDIKWVLSIFIYLGSSTLKIPNNLILICEGLSIKFKAKLVYLIIANVVYYSWHRFYSEIP